MTRFKGFHADEIAKLTTGAPLRVLGTMSGTSLDGVDAAIIETDGHVVHAFADSTYRPYTDAERTVLRAALGCWPGDGAVAEATAIMEQAHIEVIQRFGPVDLVGFHGQTFAHEPHGRGTHQAGDGAALAAACGVPVVWDFRSMDVARGGEGAPLAPAYHFALAKWLQCGEPVAFLNLGGVGNITWVDPLCDDVSQPGAVVAFDTGPANAPLNDMMQKRFGRAFDAQGAVAAGGQVDQQILDRFAGHAYFHQRPPKSLDRDAWQGLCEEVDHLPDADAAATLTAAAATGVMLGLAHLPKAPGSIFVSGGGRRNPVMMKMICERAKCPVVPVEDVGLDGDMLEAQAFAYLAVRVVKGLATSFPRTTGVQRNLSGGRISSGRIR
jgi:anhydro-N-acetylmuramic acid kinase